MLPYGRQTIEDDDIAAVTEALTGDFLTTGPKVQEFEDALCKATGAKYAVAVANGTVALHLACMILNLQKGDWAIVPAITFLATANAVRYCGADVIFADVDPDTGLMTAETFQEALDKAKTENKNVKAVLPVHLSGQPVPLQPIKDIADQHGIKVITDACHALGSQYGGKPVGCAEIEHLSAFSFHPVKTIALGEGGAVTTNNEQTANDMRRLRHHGIVAKPDQGMWYHEMPELGYNYRLTDIQCALGISQLNKLDRFLERRAELVSLYDGLFADMAPIIKTPKRISNEFIGWHLYALRIDFDAIKMTRQQVMEKLKEFGVGSQVHYIPVHTQPYYEGLYGKQTLKGAEHYYAHTLSIPLYPTLTDDNAKSVAKAFKTIIAN